MAGKASSSSSSRTAGMAAIALVVEGGGDVPSPLSSVETPPAGGEGDWVGGVTEAGVGGGDVASGTPPGGAGAEFTMVATQVSASLMLHCANA